MFNSLKYVKTLEEAGVSRAQAEAHIQIVTEVMETNLATTQDLLDTRQELKQEIIAVRHELKGEISAVRNELKEEISAVHQELKEEISEVKQGLVLLDQKIIQSEQRMTIKLGTIVSIAIGVAVTLARIVG
jgi:hypothetical protein